MTAETSIVSNDSFDRYCDLWLYLATGQGFVYSKLLGLNLGPCCHISRAISGSVRHGVCFGALLTKVCGFFRAWEKLSSAPFFTGV